MNSIISIEIFRKGISILIAGDPFQSFLHGIVFLKEHSLTLGYAFNKMRHNKKIPFRKSVPENELCKFIQEHNSEMRYKKLKNLEKRDL